MTDISDDRPVLHPNLPLRRALWLSSRLARSAWPALLFCVVAIGAWEVMAHAMDNPLIPHIGEIGIEIVRMVTSGLAFSQILTTLGRIGCGLAVATTIAAVVGFATVRSPFVQRFVEPAIILGLTVPGLVWALLCIIWFGVSFMSPVTSIALGVAPALILHAAQGLRSVDPHLLEMARVFKFSARTQLRVVWLPSLLPFIFSGLRLGFSLSWKVIVLVELFGLSNGVGYQLNSEFGAQNVAGVVAWTIVFWIVMTLIEYGLLQTLERRSTRWREATLGRAGR
jgi:NitT/TauT family transport system permease protein